MCGNLSLIVKANEGDCVYYYKREQDGIHIVKVYGKYPVVRIPDLIDGERVVFIKDYCFSDRKNDVADIWENENSMTLLAGSYIKAVHVPESVKGAGNYAFYGCSNMEKLYVGHAFEMIGSDAFMNCKRLKEIIVMSSPDEKTGLKKILSQRTITTLVTFIKEGVKAKLVYPEYYEGYSEVGPAHIFQLNVEGEGVRVRQCFDEGIVDFQQYDETFLTACQGEEESILTYMALYRLMYPYKLKEENRKIYKEYMLKHLLSICRQCVTDKDLEALQFVLKEALPTSQIISECTELASKTGWNEGAIMIINMNGGNKRSVKDRYSFD